MSYVGEYSEEEYLSAYPLDFGMGVRGAHVQGRDGKLIGILEAHKTSKGEVCAGAVFWDRPDGKERPLWKLVNLDPLTLTPSIECGCGHHGHITDGVWVPV